MKSADSKTSINPRIVQVDIEVLIEASLKHDEKLKFSLHGSQLELEPWNSAGGPCTLGGP